MRYFFALFIFTSLMLTSCQDEAKSSTSSSYSNERVIDVEWRGEKLQFTSLTNGKIPGGEQTQMWADNSSDNSHLSIRWNENSNRDGYLFNEPPTVELSFFNNGERKYFVPENPVAFELYQEDDIVLRVSGELKMIPRYELHGANDEIEGGVLKFTLQRERRRK